MKVQILYFQGCPNYEATVERVREVAASLGIPVEIEPVEVATPEMAERLRFVGSPTVRVNGIDIEPQADAAQTYAMSCRVYDDNHLPSRELLEAALRRAS